MSLLESSPIAIEKLELAIKKVDAALGLLNDLKVYPVLNGVPELLKAFRKLYWKCPGCDRMISPDQEYVTVNEEFYCVTCVEAGI